MIINANEISSVLEKCKKFASPKEFIPLALKCFKFQGNRIMAMDRHRGIVYELDGGHDFDEFLTTANLMTRIFSHIEGDAKIKVEGDHIKIEAGKFKTKIPLYREKYPFPDLNPKVSKLPKNLLETIKQVYFAVCKDTSKERFRGVLLDKNTLYATDTHRFARYTANFKNSSTFVIPDGLLEILLTEEESPESYAIVNNRFWFLYNNHKAFASTVKEPFPNCERFFSSFPKQDH